jgi:hypothetical protein
MSALRKPRAGESEITRLKALWRGLPDDARAYWQELFASSTSPVEIREQLQVKLGINLLFNLQLSRFCAWESEQRKLDAEAERQQQDEERLRAEFGDRWTLDQIRGKVLRRSYARAMVTGDFASGRKTIAQELNLKKISLDERKLALLEQKAAAYERAQAALAEIKESKGGLTEETLHKIEQELNLL